MHDLTDIELSSLVQKGAAIIRMQRESFLPKSFPLSREQRLAFGPYFPSRVVEDARIVLQDSDTPFDFGPVEDLNSPLTAYTPDVNHLNVAAFLDVLVLHPKPTDRILFHGLVVSLQYQLLGLESFMSLYLKSLARTHQHVLVPLISHAYALDQRFAAAPEAAFSVEREIQSWIDSGRYQ